jgi:maltooligosyltrehalose synthase
MNGIDLPDDLPESMIEPLSAQGFRGKKLRDAEHRSAWQEKSRHYMQKCLEYFEANVSPKIE